MGIFNALLGNASEVDLKSVENVTFDILIDGESIEKAFSIFKNKWILFS